MSSHRIVYQGKLTKVSDLTATVRELVISEISPDFNFRAGQFIMLHVPQPSGKPVLRAYSIASSDRECRNLRLLFKHVANGIASTFVWSLKGSELFHFTGPFGRVFFKEPCDAQVLFLCTGTGLAQHLCFLLSKIELFPLAQFYLYIGVHNENEIFCAEELKSLQKKFPNLIYHFVLSRPSAKWTGKKGHVQDHLSDVDLDRPTQIYLCGNGEMIKQTKEILINTKQLDPTKIFTEAFD